MGKGKIHISLIGLLSIISVFIALMVVVVSLFIRYNNLKQINDNINLLGKTDHNLELIESTIQELHEVDNNFRIYTLTYEKEYQRIYLNGLNNIIRALDTVTNYSKSKNDELNAVKSSVAEKINLEANYLNIKHLIDSLQLNALKIDSTVSVNRKMIENDYKSILNVKDEIKINIDTVSVQNIIKTRKTPGLIQKLFGSKETTEIKKGVVMRQESKNGQISGDSIKQETAENPFNQTLKKIQNEYERYYSSRINRYTINQKILQQNEKKLILKNMGLLRELEKLLSQYKTVNQLVLTYEKQNATTKVSRSVKTISNVALGSFIIILGLVSLILINLKKLSGVNAQLEEEKQRAIDDANAKEKFLAYMSHELRTPLFTISGFIEQLKQTPLNIEQSNFVVITQQSVETLLLTINDILDHSSLSRGKQRFVPIEFSARQIMSEIRSGFESLFANKGIDFEINIKGNENLVLLGDIFRLKQIYNNLISNALKYTEKGKVIVECRVDNFGEKAFLHGKIADTGIGIRKDKQNELFEEYTQLYDSKANWRLGTGLGLSICKKIVEQQGGKIWATSEEGKGSIFSFEIPFPCIDKPLQTLSEVKEEMDISRLKGLKALFVDDNKINIMLIKAMIAKWDITYDTAEDGTQALELIKEKYYDLILTDIYMPIMNGVELVTNIRALSDTRKSTVPVVAITANIMQKDIDNYKTSGITDCLFKPFKAQQLYNMITKYYSAPK